MSPGPPGVPDLISALSSGDVPVVVEPVHAPDQAAELELMLWRIRGTSAVELRELGDGAASFTVGLRRPVAMASDLRTLFGRDLVSCRREEGAFLVLLAAPPVTRERNVAPEASVPLTGHWAPEAGAGPAEPGPGPAPAEAPLDAAPAAPAAAAEAFDLAALGPVGATARLADPTTLVDALDDDPGLLVLLIDHQLRIRAVYGALAPPWGPRSATAVGDALNEVAPPHLHRGLADRVAAVLRGADESHVYTTSGGGRVYEVDLRPVGAAGGVAGCRATVRDVTGEHHDREQLRDLTGVFEVAFREAPTGQALMSPDGVWLRTNPALHRLLDRGSEALHGTRLADLLEPGDARRERVFRDEVARGARERYVVDLDPRTAGLATVGVRAHVAGITTPEGRVRGYVAHFAATGELPVALDPEIVDGPW